MSEDEKLTSAERTWLMIVREPLGATEQGIIRKLLRLYDAALARAELQEELKVIALRGEQAALARAEAAESALKVTHGLLDQAYSSMRTWHDKAVAAESALADATALLELCLPVVASQRDTYRGLVAFLSRTPAPAAWDIRGPEPVLVPAAACRDPYAPHHADPEDDPAPAAENEPDMRLRIKNDLIAAHEAHIDELERLLLGTGLEARCSELERELAAAREHFEKARKKAHRLYLARKP